MARFITHWHFFSFRIVAKHLNCLSDRKLLKFLLQACGSAAFNLKCRGMVRRWTPWQEKEGEPTVLILSHLSTCFTALNSAQRGSFIIIYASMK